MGIITGGTNRTGQTMLAKLPSLRFAILLAFIAVLTSDSSAEKVCLLTSLKSGKVSVTRKVVANGKCPKGYIEIIDTASLAGPQGEQGPSGAVGPTGSAGATGANGSNGTNGSAGADGSLRIYGNGSAGELNTTSPTTTLTSGNLQFTNITVNAGHTLNVPSGAVLRCTGTLTVSGTIQVGVGGAGGSVEVGDPASPITFANIRPPSQGLSKYVAGNGEYGDNGRLLLGGGNNSPSLTVGEAAQIRYPGPVSCGGGAGSIVSVGGSSGGSLVVLCKTGIVVSSSGIISANSLEIPATAAGGGAGGILILATAGSFTNDGNLTARGGTGGSSHIQAAAGGGGGGGVVHILAPSIFPGTINVLGGSGGSTSTATVSSAFRQAGGAGGGCGGKGGQGSDVGATPGNAQSASGNGVAGHVIQTLVDPTALF